MDETVLPSLHSLLRDLPLPLPHTVAPLASLRSVLQGFHAGADDAVVADPDSGVPLGVITVRDVVGALLDTGLDLDGPAVGAMTGGIPSLSGEATMQQAMVLMVRRGLAHLFVVDNDNRLLRLLGRHQLYGLRAAGSDGEVAAVLAAKDIDALARAAAAVRAFAARRLAEGVGAEALCQWISALNDIITARAIDLVEGANELPIVPWCWMVFGSEGRLEQTLFTDQDNGIVFEAESAAEADQLRQVFVPFAQEVNRALDACGFPLCQGGIMAGNPDWCLSATEWRGRFGDWIGNAAPKALLNATIFFDFRPLYGREDIVASLQQWLLKRIAETPAFLHAMAINALDAAPPLGMWNRFRYDDDAHPHTIDLKMQGSRFFVDAARIYALAHGVAHTHTVERLRLARPALGMPLEECAAAIEAFYQIQRLRLRNQVAQASPAAANRIDPAQLNDLDRHILREALRLARRLQQRLELDYRP